LLSLSRSDTSLLWWVVQTLTRPGETGWDSSLPLTAPSEGGSGRESLLLFRILSPINKDQHLRTFGTLSFIPTPLNYVSSIYHVC
jgi:hypothetical protein